MVEQAIGGVPQESDADLVKRARSEPAAFDTLWSRYEKPILKYLYYKTGNFHDAEDLRSVVCMRAFRFIYRPNPEHSSRKEFIMKEDISFKVWLFRIAYNTKVGFLEQRSSHPLSYLDNVPEASLWSSHFSDPEEELEKAEERIAVRRAVAGLQTAQQKLILLKVVRDLSNAEVAQELGIGEGAVKSRYNRAIKRLKRSVFKAI